MVDEGVQPYQPLEVSSLAGGINTRVFPLLIADNEAVELTNIDTSTPGERVTRAGTAIAATGITTGPILAMSEYKPPNGDTVLLAVSPGLSAGDHKQAWEWDGALTMFTHLGALTGYTAAYETDDGRMEIITGFDLDASVDQIAVFNTAQNGAPRWYYDGSVITNQAHWGDAGGSGNPPNTIPVVYYRNRGFGRGYTNRETIYFSNVASWTASLAGGPSFPGVAQSIVFGGQTKDEIIALSQYRTNELIIHMSDRTEKLNITEQINPTFTTGAFDPYAFWSREVIDYEKGCCSKESVASSGSDVFFADQDCNIRSVARTIQDNAQGVESLPISEPLDAWIKRINPLARQRIVGRTFDRWYLLGLPIDSATEADHVFALDVARTAQLQRPVWDGPWTGNWKPYSMAVATLDTATDSDDLNPTLYIGSTVTTEGFVYKGFRGTTDAGDPILHQELGKRHSVGSLLIHKQGKRLDVFAVASGDVTVHVEGNADARGWETIGHFNTSGDVPQLPVEIPFDLGGVGVVDAHFDLQDFGWWRDIQFRMTATSSIPVKVLSYAALIQPQNYREYVSS